MAAYKEMPPLFISMSKVDLCKCHKDLTVGNFMHSTISVAALHEDVKKQEDEAATDPPSAEPAGDMEVG